MSDTTTETPPARPLVVAVVGATATGKSALALALAERFGGEIINCDSTAVYRGFDIGTDKVMPHERRGIPHHLIDIVEPTEVYTAARFATEAAALIHALTARGVLPIVVGGTGLYYRALTRGLFPGPPADEALRARLDRVADRRGVRALHRWLARVDAASAARILPGDRKRIVRALEVWLLTGQTLTAQFAATRSPLAGYDVLAFGLRIPPALTAVRVAARVEAQFARGVVDEVRRLLDAGVPDSARPFGGLVYRQVMDALRGVRDDAATRALIAQENRRYARRQRAWFAAEPGLEWLDGPGESVAVIEAASATVARARALRAAHPHHQS